MDSFTGKSPGNKLMSTGSSHSHRLRESDHSTSGVKIHNFVTDGSMNNSLSPILKNVKKNLSASLAACEVDLSANSLSSISSTEKSRLNEFENSTIQKQRQELQLLIVELRERDQELNQMVAAHQQQLKGWEQDRHRLLSLEERCADLRGQLEGKTEEVRQLSSRVRAAENEDLNKSSALENTQEQLTQISQSHTQQNIFLEELQGRNRSLGNSIHEMSDFISTMEAREQELLSVLKLKDRDMAEAMSRVAEMNAKHKRVQSQYNESRDQESELRRQVSDWKNKCSDAVRENEHAQAEYRKSFHNQECQALQIQELKLEIATLKKEVFLTGDREKRKDQLLELQKSKQERCEAESNNLRQLYERQQRDLSLLHINLENTKELLAKHNAVVPVSGFNAKKSKTQSENQLKYTRTPSKMNGSLNLSENSHITEDDIHTTGSTNYRSHFTENSRIPYDSYTGYTYPLKVDPVNTILNLSSDLTNLDPYLSAVGKARQEKSYKKTKPSVSPNYAPQMKTRSVDKSVDSYKVQHDTDKKEYFCDTHPKPTIEDIKSRTLSSANVGTGTGSRHPMDRRPLKIDDIVIQHKKPTVSEQSNVLRAVTPFERKTSFPTKNTPFDNCNSDVAAIESKNSLTGIDPQSDGLNTTDSLLEAVALQYTEDTSDAMHIKDEKIKHSSTIMGPVLTDTGSDLSDTTGKHKNEDIGSRHRGTSDIINDMAESSQQDSKGDSQCNSLNTTIKTSTNSSINETMELLNAVVIDGNGMFQNDDVQSPRSHQEEDNSTQNEPNDNSPSAQSNQTNGRSSAGTPTGSGSVSNDNMKIEDKMRATYTIESNQKWLPHDEPENMFFQHDSNQSPIINEANSIDTTEYPSSKDDKRCSSGSSDNQSTPQKEPKKDIRSEFDDAETLSPIKKSVIEKPTDLNDLELNISEVDIDENAGLERSSTPVSEHSAQSEFESPASKLTKLLTESHELAKDLERTSASNNSQDSHNTDPL